MGGIGSGKKSYLPEMIRKRIEEDDSDECWIWEYSKGNNGYGILVHPDTKIHTSPHRYAFEVANGSIDSFLEIDHTCSTRDCWNYKHLEQVTTKENHKRWMDKTNRCPKGHFITKKENHTLCYSV